MLCHTQTTVRFESPCYELKKIPLEVTNPFAEDGVFQIIVVEEHGGFGKNAQQNNSKKTKKKKRANRELASPPVEPELDLTQFEEYEGDGEYIYII